LLGYGVAAVLDILGRDRGRRCLEKGIESLPLGVASVLPSARLSLQVFSFRFGWMFSFLSRRGDGITVRSGTVKCLGSRGLGDFVEKPDAAGGSAHDPTRGRADQAQNKFVLQTRHLDEIWTTAQRIRSEFLGQRLTRR
jgi:hypothetical protein